MPERPDGAHLLRLARASLLGDLGAALGEAERYTARLIAKAMAIAAQELEAGEAPAEAERAALAKLFREDREEAQALVKAETTDEALQRLKWRLAAEIRGGERDADARVHALLREAAVARLEIVNPSAAEET